MSIKGGFVSARSIDTTNKGISDRRATYKFFQRLKAASDLYGAGPNTDNATFLKDFCELLGGGKAGSKVVALETLTKDVMNAREQDPKFSLKDVKELLKLETSGV